MKIDEHIDEELVRRLFFFIHNRVKDEDLANDIVQDSLLKAIDSLEQLQDEGKFVSWLFQIARNAIPDYFRKLKKEMPLESIAESELISNDFEQEQNTLQCCILDMLKHLKDSQREALERVDLEGMSQKKLAEELEISHSGAKSRVQRARVELKKLLEDCCKIKADKYGNLVEVESKGSSDCNC